MRYLFSFGFRGCDFDSFSNESSIETMRHAFREGRAPKRESQSGYQREARVLENHHLRSEGEQARSLLLSPLSTLSSSKSHNPFFSLALSYINTSSHSSPPRSSPSASSSPGSSSA